ncbi:hypothetical protein ANCCEY_10300 [Ancylostoma ceylanicum]|uniref:Uncharacterized protein n=1 Tax=Ancylostoma ceylanicum TaxID=53326 RepID=A0A0D6LHE4_9BILA|nr:hypothetical protein ANCCEY_10300 [Ancylostoma ceylanicum]
MPCFREKILECGDDKQRRLLNGVNKMINFLCTPASVAAQRMTGMSFKVETREINRYLRTMPHAPIRFRLSDEGLDF